MVTNYIINFSSYLNNRGYAISNDKISRFFSMAQDESIDFTNEKDVVEMMQVAFCSSKEQFEELPIHFATFMKDEHKEDAIIDAKKTLEKNARSFQNKRTTYEKRLQDIERKKQAELSKVYNDDTNEKSNNLINKDKNFLKEHMKEIKKLNLKNKTRIKKDEEFNNFVTDFMKSLTYEDFTTLYKYNNEMFQQLLNSLIELSEKALINGDIKTFQFIQKLFDIFKKLFKNLEKEKRGKSGKIQDIKNKFDRKASKIRNEWEKEKREHDQTQEELNNRIRKLKDAINATMQKVHKAQSQHHREEFIGGNNAIQLIGDVIPPNLDVTFNKLKDEDLTNIYKYIKRNLLRFKTKMTRNINTQNCHNIDMKTTIQYACKTNGLPMNIIYEKPIINKANLVLILDISGSCKNAARMMLSFMYLLQSVFPRGCKTFAFVDSLYDISNVMNANDIDGAIKEVFDVIPTRGIYSNYYIPLQSLWKKHRKIITKDSVVIFIGDARNNMNPTGIEYVKNIARKANKAYWLNTEPKEKWGYQDSLALEYMEYFKMFECLTTSDIIRFIQKI